MEDKDLQPTQQNDKKIEEASQLCLKKKLVIQRHTEEEKEGVNTVVWILEWIWIIS